MSTRRSQTSRMISPPEFSAMITEISEQVTSTELTGRMKTISTWSNSQYSGHYIWIMDCDGNNGWSWKQLLHQIRTMITRWQPWLTIINQYQNHYQPRRTINHQLTIGYLTIINHQIGILDHQVTIADHQLTIMNQC